MTMNGLDDLKLTPVWVNPGHTVQSARILMKGHGVKSIAVVEGPRLLGVVTMETLEGAREDAPCGEFVRPVERMLPHSMTVLQAAQAFVDEDLTHAVVMDGDRFVGLITPNVLIRVLRRSWDPLTGLGWSDRIREWAAEMLSKGEEISILFIDLDNFGAYNKTYGHTVGDRVLRRVSHLLRQMIDPERDLLVRYGGDEFAIATLRHREEAEQLLLKIKEQSGIASDDEPYRPITFTVGLAGGRRSQGRQNVHIASTVEDLLLTASKDCLSRKRRLEEMG